jgi:ABC-type lipoprotein release transport system permease subunit
MEAALRGVGQIEVVDWRQLSPDYVAIAEYERNATGIILFLVIVIAAVGISNTILMSVLERTRELGMMRAIGMRSREIKTTLLAEAGMIGFLGSIAGMILGAIANLYMTTVGIDYTAYLREMDMGYRITEVMYSAWNPPAFLFALVFGILMATITAYPPIRRALRLRIIDSLHRG